MEEVADVEDEPHAPGEAPLVAGNGNEQGNQVVSARLWCRTQGCGGARACEHIRHVRAAFGYIAAPDASAQHLFN